MAKCNHFDSKCIHSPPMQVLAAHICYAAAMQTPGFVDDPETSSHPAIASAAVSAAASSALTSGSPSRYCLLGADHRLNPRTYCSSSLAAIQRTEVLEWAVLQQSASPPSRSASTPSGGAEREHHPSLLSLQPYKLLYAHTLAEFGRVTEALAYCQVHECHQSRA